MELIKPNYFGSLFNSENPHLPGEMMGLMISGKVKSEKEAKEKARLNNAVQTGDVELLQQLIKEGASPNDSVFDDCLLTRAIWRGKIESVRLLLACGADPNPTKGCPPLLQAIMQSSIEAAKLLIASGAKVNAQSFGDQPELFSACLACHQEMVELLILHGAKIDLCGTAYVTKKHIVQKVTPLMIAAWLGKSAIVKCLLNAGARLNAKDAEGCTALDWAKRCRAKKAGEKVVGLLKKSCPPKS